MNDTIENCPFCAGACVTSKGFTTSGDWPHGDFWRVFCGSCQARQLFHRTEAEAIAAWNHRAASNPPEIEGIATPPTSQAVDSGEGSIDEFGFVTRLRAHREAPDMHEAMRASRALLDFCNQHVAAARKAGYEQGRYDESMAQGPSRAEWAAIDAERDGAAPDLRQTQAETAQQAAVLPEARFAAEVHPAAAVYLVSEYRAALALRQPQGDYDMDDRDLARRIMTFMGRATSGSNEPGADPLADRLAEKLAEWRVVAAKQAGKEAT